ncbi:exodeoxyribonuclease VII large subunit [Methylobacillus gramineus]|uniref:exodeoxyribonuclease VII large subunit n=1 Tax=Methylobacillus gramineus TaxID=755169 RepID=UPI001CFFDD79|nr:exodeoxyribonuclease VII large subunit [Methylobacillus gramineus]MCB5184717.1 exodeoxyribonuclease VII large subunit [Methylobacillus gramineus]
MTDSQRVLSVSELNRMARELLERSFPLFWISGEISNLTRAASGHWYFSLKDQGAQVRCVMFRGRNSYLDWIPKEGDKVEARAVVTLYEARGDFQLTIEFLQRAGLGSLYEAYEKLKAKLEAEGLFSAEFKQPIPAHPRQIGIVTSADAAALRDVLTTLRRRMPAVNVVIYPTPVQGKGAAELIANAIRTADARAECDVLIVCRGGGSIEDLWQFNEEVVARAIHACRLPVISAVGHETDFTIADFVADHRAATPTAAAELTTPDRLSLLQGVGQLSQRLERTLRNLLNQRAQHLDYLSRRLLSPLQQVAHRRNHLQQLHLRLQHGMERQLQKQRQQLLRLQQNLSHLNPNAVLQRGYALVEKTNGELVYDSKQLAPGDNVRLKLGTGSADAEIKSVKP